MGPLPKTPAGPEREFRAQKWEGPNSSFLPLGAFCDGETETPPKWGGRAGPPVTVFGGLGLLMPPASPQIHGFSFPLEQFSRKSGGPLLHPSPPGHRPPGMGDIGSASKPHGSRRNTPKSGVPEEMGSAAECPTGCTAPVGASKLRFFPIFQKKGGAPPPS